MRNRLLFAASAAIVLSGFGTVISGQPRDRSVAMQWRQIGPTRAGRARARGRAEPAERVLYRVRQRRRVALHGLRVDVAADLRRSADRIDWRHCRRAVRSEHHLRRVRRRNHSARSRRRRRCLQVDRRGTHMDASRAARLADDRDDRRRPAQSQSPFRGGARPEGCANSAGSRRSPVFA